MATTIKLKNGSGAPLAGDLVQGEPALDLTNKRLYTEDSGGTVIEVGTNPTSLTTGTFTSTGIDDNATSTAITIDASENVGIGTASPTNLFHVSATGLSTPALIQSTSTVSRLAFRDTNTTDSNSVRLGSAGDDMSFLAGGSERMRIDNSGKVGIGTTSPDRTLSIQGDASTNIPLTIESGTGQTNCLAAFRDPHTTQAYKVAIGCDGDDLIARAGGTERMRIDSSGALMVGTTSAGGVGGATIDTAASHTDLKLYGATASYGGRVFFGDSSDRCSIRGTYDVGGGGRLTFHTDTTGGTDLERMRINNAGNVGIGTTSPSSKLSLIASSVNGLHLGQQSDNTANSSRLFFDNSTNIWTAYSTLGTFKIASGATIGSSSGTDRLIIGSTGSILYSSSGGEGYTFGASGSSAGVANMFCPAGYTLAFGTNSSERMRIDSSGNLLVGTTSTVGASSVAGVTISQVSGIGQISIGKTYSGSTSAAKFYFGTTQVGRIDYSDTATTYITSSDQRLKENIVDAPAGNIDAIRVRSFDWKADGSHQTYGMVAQELVDVAPEAVSQGETEDDMWGVDYSKLVPMMIKEIQDLKAEVAALKGA